MQASRPRFRQVAGRDMHRFPLRCLLGLDFKHRRGYNSNIVTDSIDTET
jgi:hypothetical protein